MFNNNLLMAVNYLGLLECIHNLVIVVIFFSRHNIYLILRKHQTLRLTIEYKFFLSESRGLQKHQPIKEQDGLAA